jgi:peptidase M28-like protein
MTSIALAVVATSACFSVQRPAAPSFDGSRAYVHVEQLAGIGPRVAGSAGAAHARGYIRTQLEALGLRVEEQPFDARTPLGPVRMVNVRAFVPGAASTGRLVFAGHYDTKRFDEFTFVGANDGGSSAGFLIELARVLKSRANAQPIELLFLDGEEAVVEWQGDDHTYGSRHYVEQARKDGSIKDIRALILVDMIGDRDLRIKRESRSTPWLTDLIWRAAKDARRPAFVDESTPIDDDHLPFLEAGVDATDIIDLDYPWWHQPGDTIDKVAPESLETVGDVLMTALPEIEKRLR